jgi:hypothetical protein
VTVGSVTVPSAVLLRIAVGLGGDTFVSARGHSYLTNDPTPA